MFIIREKSRFLRCALWPALGAFLRDIGGKIAGILQCRVLNQWERSCHIFLSEKPIPTVCFGGTVKPVFRGHTKIDKTKVLKTNGSLLKVESIAECSLGKFLT